MDNQSSDVDGLVYALNELLNVQDVQELESASSNEEALVDTLNSQLNIQDVQELESTSSNVEPLVDTVNSLDIQESKYASSNVEKLESSFEKKYELLGSWSELPPEIPYRVSEHLFDPDLINFRATCQSWRSNAPLFRCHTFLDTPDFESTCNLMSLGVLGNKCRFFHPLKCNGTYQIVDIPELLGARLHYSKKGWLLLSATNRRGDCRFFFFHPINMLKIELPTNSFSFHTMSFSSPPTSKDCFVIGIPLWGYEFGVIRRGEESWNIFRFNQPLPNKYFLSNCNPVLYKGRCYCLCEKGELGVFDLNEYLRNPECQNLFNWTHIVRSGFPAGLCDSVLQSYLVESNGQLFSVFELEDYAPCIHVFSLNPNKSRMKWHAVENLSNQTFYVSAAGSFSETTVGSGAGIGNKIYLPNVQDNRCVFYSLSLKKQMCGSFFSDYTTRISTHGKEHTNCTWIKPTLATLDENFKW